MSPAKKFESDPEDQSYLDEHYYIVYSRKSKHHFRFVQNTSEINSAEETTEPSVIRPPKHENKIRSLCANCNSLDLSGQAPKYFHKWRINLGFLSMITSTQRCSLCNAITELLPPRIRRRICESMSQKETRLQVYLAAAFDRTAVPRGPPGFRIGVWSCDLSRRLSGIIGDWWSSSTSHNSHLDYTGTLRHFGLLRVQIRPPLKQVPSSSPPSDLAAVELPDFCNLEFVKEAMARCTNEHSEICNIPRHTDPADGRNQHYQADALRTIDVIIMQLIDHPRDNSFAALSYNWDHSGNGQFICTTKSNIEDLRAPRGLLSMDLPQTVTDAIYVCQQSGLRHLWVDSLCIIQDSDEDKSQQIRRMDQIHGAASVAIVVACGTDPSKGITTLRERSPRQIRMSVGGLDLIITEPPLENALRNSTWNTRGWTFQEFMLPRRLVVFTSSQAYFVCAQGIIAEDTIGGHAYDVVSGDEVRRDPFTIWNMPSTVGQSSRQRTNWDIYRHAVSSYTQRNLTFTSDRLAAISGVLGALGSFTKDTFICGLPAKVFPGALIWCSTGASSRCAEFPSWSWAGWLGEVTYPGRSHVSLGAHLLSDRIVRLTSDLTDIKFCSSDGVEMPIIQYINKYNGAPQPVGWFKDLTVKEYCHTIKADSNRPGNQYLLYLQLTYFTSESITQASR